MNGKRYLLDTNIILYLLDGSLDHTMIPDGEYFVSVITEMELLSYPQLSSSEEALIMGFLKQVSIIGLSDQVKHETIALRRQKQIRLPDAVIVATAIAASATVLTRDKQLVKMFRGIVQLV